jgi:hypothetical protein
MCPVKKIILPIKTSYKVLIIEGKIIIIKCERVRNETMIKFFFFFFMCVYRVNLKELFNSFGKIKVTNL